MNMEGIPINDLIKWAEKKRMIEESRSGIRPIVAEVPVREDEVCPEDIDFIKNIESEFTVQADGILEALNLSHLRAGTQKRARYDL
jgi:hypothetical protein